MFSIELRVVLVLSDSTLAFFAFAAFTAACTANSSTSHSEDYGVLLTVLEGKGIFTDINGESTLTKNQSIYIKKDEIRGIKAEEDLIILGIQDRGKGGFEKNEN